MRPILSVCFGVASLAFVGCQVNPEATLPPVATPVREVEATFVSATPTTIVGLERTSTPAATIPVEPTHVPLEFRPQSCPQQSQRSYQHVGSSHLLVTASSGAVQGLFELSLVDGTARLVVEEPEWIAKVGVSEDHTWLVYSTLCEPGVTCAANARPDDPSHWVVADLSGHIYSRTVWTQTPDAYAWRLLGGIPDAVRVLGGIDGAEEWSPLNRASQINLPSGYEQANYFGMSDETASTSLISTHFVVSPDLRHEAHYAFDPSRSEGSIRLGELPGVVTREWSIPDGGSVASAGNGYRMVWSPDSTSLAVTLAHAGTGVNGEVYLLDMETRQTEQVTDLAGQLASYFAAPTTWSMAGDKLAIRVYSDQGNDTLVADFGVGRLRNLCVDSTRGDAVWDYAGRILAIQKDPNALWVYTTDEPQLYSVMTDLTIRQVVAWLP